MRLPISGIFWWLWLIAVSGSLAQVDGECISICNCMWVTGKQTAECKRQNLTELPTGLSTEIQHLDLSGNAIEQLGERAFTRVQLENLQKLAMRDCALRVLNSKVFHGLRIVIEIDLSNNKLRKLSPGTFEETERLRVLLLNNNRLERLEDGLFSDLSFLQKIELSNNHLVQIGQWSFRNLPKLASLALDGNNLTCLEVATFKSLPKLSSLELRKNPWHCDCHLRLFREWVLQKNLYTRPTACAQPNQLAMRFWDDLSSEEFACLPPVGTLESMTIE